jgi:exosortase A
MNLARHNDIALLAVALLILLTAYWPTALSMAEIWGRSQTFAHGFLVLPLSAWMIWRQRDLLAAVPRTPWPPALALLAVTGSTWLMAALANVQIIEQYCLVMMGVCLVAALLGAAFARAAAFPMAFLLLAVPCGEVFIPPLMNFTASFVTTALRAIGVPVFRDNHDFSLPTGSWSVVEACSGLRYMIAALALGLVYVHLNFRQLGARLRFMLLVLVVPVIANGLRAFLVVLIGHLSDMRLATGIDHLLYGWLFFGLVMGLLFWLGSGWREPAASAPPAPPPAASYQTRSNPLAVFGMACGLAIVYPYAAAQFDPASSSPCGTAEKMTMPAAPPGWRTTALGPLDWRPMHRGCFGYGEARYLGAGRSATLHLTRYRKQPQNADLLAAVTREREAGKPLWREMPGTTHLVHIGRTSLWVQQFQIESESGKLLAWRWYVQSGQQTSRPELVKLFLAASKLARRDQAGAEIVLTAPYENDPAAAAISLQTLLGPLLTAIETELDHAGN